MIEFDSLVHGVIFTKIFIRPSAISYIMERWNSTNNNPALVMNDGTIFELPNDTYLDAKRKWIDGLSMGDTYP